MKFRFTILFLFAVSLGVSQTGAVSGTVMTSDKKPAAFVSIGIKDSPKGTTAGADGSFKLENIESGHHTLVVSYVGLQSVSTEVNVIEGQITQLQPIVLQESAHELNEVIITGLQNLNDKPVTIGKTAIRPMDLPQSIAYIDKEVLEKQQVQYMSEALKNFNGVYIMSTSGGVQQEIAARGFAFSSSNTFKNGVRFNNAVMPEMSALERVEVLKGSSAILFGNVAAGGVINLVTKKPTFTNGGVLAMRFDSYNFYKPTLDIYGTLDKNNKAAFRLNSAYENAGSFRDNVRSERVYFNPSVMVKAGRKTDILIEGDFLRDNRTSDYGVGSINYQLINIPRNRFLGASWSYYNTMQKSATATITHRINRNWQIRQVTSAQTFSNDFFTTTRPNANNSFVKEDGKWIRGVQRTQTDDMYYLAQLDLTGKFNTGAVNHNVLLGADYDEYNTNVTAYNTLSKYDSINVFNPDQYQQRKDIPDLDKKTLTATPIHRAGIYFQDLVSLMPKLKLLAGARLSYIETFSKVFTYKTQTTTRTAQYDYAVTPRLGIVYQPSGDISLFTSYANSFTPNTGVDVNGKALTPSYINQVEAGIKTNLFRDLMSANFTVYQIVNSNLAQTSLANGNTNSNVKELAGEVTSQGCEADIMSKSFYGFNIIAGYSYNETKYTRSNTYIEGSLLRYNPKHTANASLYYTINRGPLAGMNFGFGGLYFGERQAGRSTRVTVANDPYRLMNIPAYTTFDANAGYSMDRVSVRLKVSNIFNAVSYNVHDDNSVNPIAPRQFAATVSYRF